MNNNDFELPEYNDFIEKYNELRTIISKIELNNNITERLIDINQKLEQTNLEIYKLLMEINDNNNIEPSPNEIERRKDLALWENVKNKFGPAISFYVLTLSQSI
jgi:hypothetical protein